MDKIFAEKVNAVFNPDWTRKVCGRQKNMELIAECRRLDPSKEEGYFGCAKTGAISEEQKDRIKQLYESMC